MSTRDERSAGHERLTELFTRACELEGAARAAFLDAECGGESELRPAGWGTVTPIQLLPDVPRDLGDVGDALNPNVNSQDIDWSAVQ